MNFTSRVSMDNNRKQKSFTVSRINILVQVDAGIGTHVELTSWLRRSVTTYCCEEP
jgi:hypothetical protein